MTAKTTVPSAAHPPARPRLALAVLYVSLLIVTLDNTVLNVVAGSLADRVHGPIRPALAILRG